MFGREREREFEILRERVCVRESQRERAPVKRLLTSHLPSSPSQVAAEEKRHGGGGKMAKAKATSEGHQQQGLPWLLFELMWRDFFRFVTLKHTAARSPATTKATQVVAAAPSLA